MAENKVVGISFWGALALLFIAFKITGYIDWSWIWVLAPLWAPFAVAMLFTATMLLLAVVFDLEEK